VYFDTCYIAKFYFNEPDSLGVRELVQEANAPILSSAWALAELHTVIHRRIREGGVKRDLGRAIAAQFLSHIQLGLWSLIPVSQALLLRASESVITAPADLFLRTGDAVHLTAARDSGVGEIWTSDRHMLAAAPYFGLEGKSV
jgi:predicted nucleic acid-binding protein